VPVRAATSRTVTAANGARFISWYESVFLGGSLRTYYPNQLRTSWNFLFGY
jgi:hypothetical protein